MKRILAFDLFDVLKRKISVVLIVSMLLTNISQAASIYDKEVNYQFANELETDETLIDVGMFYMPYSSIETNEGNVESKYVFKVKRKGEALPSAKAKLTMVDLSGKYGRDYTIKVIDKAVFSENVKNKSVSKSVKEYLESSEYEEYNYSDAIVDGAIDPGDILTDNEMQNYTIANEEKDRIIDDVKTVSKNIGMDMDIVSDDTQNESNETVTGFTSSEPLESNIDIDEKDVDSVSADKDNLLIKNDMEGSQDSDSVVSSESEMFDDSYVENASENENENADSDEKNCIDITKLFDQNDSNFSKDNNESNNKNASNDSGGDSDGDGIDIINISTFNEIAKPVIDNNIISTSSDVYFYAASESDIFLEDDIVETSRSTSSDIIYSDDKVEFENINTSTMSVAEGYEKATGLKSDRKSVLPNRGIDVFNLNKNSLSDRAYLHDSIKAVEDELKSAYVVLDFKEKQNEKLIEITINNDKKFTGDKQVGFNLSPVEDSEIAGMYSSLTLIIHDDEKEELEYINFTKSEYSPDDGYITVDIERSGKVNDISTCMVDTEDIIAKSGRDYSKVHAKVVFAMGINKRTLKIPISSENIDGKMATFKLKLQDPVGALIGDNNIAYCTIKRGDKSFIPKKSKIADKTEMKENVLGDSKKTDVSIEETMTSGDTRFGGSDYDLDSIKTEEAINLKEAVYSVKSKNANSSSYFQYINADKGLKVYLENHDFGGETAWYSWGVNARQFIGDRNDVSGIQIDWNMSGTNNKLVFQEYMRSTESWRDLWSGSGQEWGNTTNNYFLENPALSYLSFALYRYDGMWRTSPTFTINSIKPILRMYKINNLEADIPELIDENGNLTKNHKYSKYGITSIEGHKSDHTAVGWSGKTITVKLDNSVDNPFYIKRIMIRKDDGTIREVVRNTNQEATTLSFEINNQFATTYQDYIKLVSRPGGGRNGEFNIYAELGTKPSTIKIVKDNRVDVNIWNKKPKSSTEETDTYEYNIGDVLHFNANVKNNFKNLFDCVGLNVYMVKPYSPDWSTIRKPTDGSEYFPMDAKYTEVRVEPNLAEKDNMIKIRVKKDDFSKFDKQYGIFKNIKYTDIDGYYEIYTEHGTSDFVGRYIELKARCSDENTVPVWYEKNKDSVKYVQNTYYFLGSEQQDDNIIYLSAETADSIDYSINGTAYYEEVPIGGKTVDKKWQIASNVGIIIDDTHYAYTESDGTFDTIPGKGKNGYYNKIKVASNGVNKYITVKLNQDNLVTKKYEIEYDTETKTIEKKVYEVKIEEILINNVDNEHPHITGVNVYNMAGSSFGAVYINDNISILKAKVTPVKSNGEQYKYTYNDEYGIEHTEIESVKRVEFLAVDMNNHKIKKVIEATMSNADKTEWDAYYSFEKGHYAEYNSGDKLYVRIVTDKKIGDGKGDDIGESNNRRLIPIFNETTYQAIPTTLPFIEEAERQPDIVDFKFISDGGVLSSVPEGNKVELPLLGGLTTMINALGMVFSIQTEGERIRVSLGKKFNGKGNHYDGNGKPVSDVGYAINLSNVEEGLDDMADFIKGAGKKRLNTMTLGLPAWSIDPTAGIYFEFIMYHDAENPYAKKYEFTGGGGYVGAIANLRYTFYFLVLGVPCYVGGDLALTLVGEFGVAVDDGKHIQYSEPNQAFFDGLFNDTHFEFLFRAKLDASAYAGVGIVGVIGIRGGFTLTLTFLYNPFVKQKFANVRPVGFSVTGAIKLWADAVILSVPIPVYKWPYPYNLGYFEDINKVMPESSLNNNKIAYNSDAELKPRPRSDIDSIFVANDDIDNDLFGGTYEIVDDKTLINNVYDSGEPMMLKYNDNKALLVYLDDDHNRGSLDRTVLRYMIYDALSDTWSEPQNIWVGNDTADFSPNLCDCGDKILLSWSSRPISVSDDTAKADLIKNMEIYTSFFDKNTETFGTIERMTDDDSYDYYPRAVYDEETNVVSLYFLKKDGITDINNADDLLNKIQPEVNGARLMYMLHDDPDGTGSRWLRDYYYLYELPETLSDEERNEFINTWRGQRFANLSIDIGGGTSIVNDPSISDYAVYSTRVYDTTDINSEIQGIRSEFSSNVAYPASLGEPLRTRINNFHDSYIRANKLFKVLCYVTEADGDLSTKNDTEIYIKMRSATESDVKTIRVTNNNVPDMMPRILCNNDNAYLFFVENESIIKMIDLNNLIFKASDEEHSSNQIGLGEVRIETAEKEIIGDKISNYYPFTDDNNNIYLAWQQDSTDGKSLTDNFEIEFKQDLYVAGFIESENADGSKEYSWSTSVRFTDNGKVNNLPTAIDINNKLLLVNNQYNLVSEGDGYIISNSTLNAMSYAPKSSLEICEITPELINVLNDDSAEYRINVTLHNTGLNVARGFDYTGNIKYDGRDIVSFSGGTDDYVIPGAETIIGKDSKVTGNVSLPDIKFTLSSEERKHLDKVSITINSVERNIGDSGSTTSANVFDASVKFSFVTYNEDTYDASDKYLRVEQSGDQFIIKGILKNTGDVDSNGDEKIYVIDQDNWDKDVASSEYIKLDMNGQIEFSIPIDSTLFKKLDSGIKDLVVYVKNDEGTILSDYEIATINAKEPFNFKINGVNDLIELKVGEAMKLNTTYEPSLRYRNATIIYTSEDNSILTNIGATITGTSVGETTLKLTTKEFGGSKSIKVRVIDDVKPHNGGGSGGSGGGGKGVISQNGGKKYVSTILSGNKIYNNPPAGKWYLDTISNTYKFELSDLYNVMTLNENCEVANTGYKSYLANGMYKLGSDGNYYLFDSLGNMKTGLQSFNNSFYYFEVDGQNMGAMVTGERSINGMLYTFDKNGVMLMPDDGIIKVVNGEWIYYPDINKWSFNAYQVLNEKISLKNGYYLIKNYDGTFTKYFFDINGFLIE